FYLIRDIGIISVSKSAVANGRPDTIKLDVDALAAEHIDETFVTAAVKTRIEKALLEPKPLPFPKLGYRMLEVLAEAELAGGSLAGVTPTQIARLTGTRVGPDTYIKSLRS